MKIDSIIFDLDDTLYPEKDYVLSGFKKISNYLGNKYDINEREIFTQLKKDFNRGVRGKNFDLILNKFGLEEDIETLINIYRSHRPSISLFQDARKTLEDLDGKKKLGLLTGGPRKSQRKKINSLRIKSFFDKIIIVDELKGDYSKLSEKPYKMLLEEFNLPPESIMYVGDNPKKDFIIPNCLGMMTLRVKREVGEYSSLEAETKKEMPNFNISNLQDFFKILDF